MEDEQKTVLFLCTGNYYRSRFAEELFNARVSKCLPNWKAISRALAIERGVANKGPISPFAVAGLERRKITPSSPFREPLECTENVLLQASHVVALKEREHRTMLEEKFPEWSDRVEYWHVHDVDEALPEQALAEIQKNVKGLILKLAG
jgi:protein-tyrosine phosphatase